MNPRQDGGAAFPHMLEHHGPDIYGQLTHGGMSLRDYFAAQALVMAAVMLASRPTPPEGTLLPGSVTLAYQIADAMLLEREK